MTRMWIRNDGLAPINLAKCLGCNEVTTLETIIFGSNTTNTTINTPFSFLVHRATYIRYVLIVHTYVKYT